MNVFNCYMNVAVSVTIESYVIYLHAITMRCYVWVQNVRWEKRVQSYPDPSIPPWCWQSPFHQALNGTISEMEGKREKYGKVWKEQLPQKHFKIFKCPPKLATSQRACVGLSLVCGRISKHGNCSWATIAFVMNHVKDGCTKSQSFVDLARKLPVFRRDNWMQLPSSLLLPRSGPDQTNQQWMIMLWFPGEKIPFPVYYIQ